MLKLNYINVFLSFFVIIIFSLKCKKPFEPPAITAKNNYLVVDGVINTGANSVTKINLNRTRNLLDTATIGTPELNANVSILSSNGNVYLLSDANNTGSYISDILNLDTVQKYSIDISTSDGRKYASDFVTSKYTWPIDSVYWLQPSDLTIYIDTHDPANNTHYYRWEYSETWEHDAQLQTAWRVSNGLIVPTDSITQKSLCWTTNNATDILLASTATLSADVVHRFPLVTILNPDIKLDKRYSINVLQYALTEDAYNYWQLIQKTSQTLGSFFDLQPSQLNGNIHSLSNPDEPVIGFISASSIQQQRIFISNSSLKNWQLNPIVYTCDTLEVPVNQFDYRIYTDDHPGYAPFYFISNGPLVIATSICLDCTLFGGSNIKPSFW
jgi:hypothetical protein